MFKADDYRLRAKALADTLQETKEALDVDILVGKLAQLKAEQEKPEVWQDLEKSTKLGREISSVEGKIHSYEKGKKALEEVNSVIDLIEETEEEDLVPELESLLKTVEEDLEEMRIRTLLRGDSLRIVVQRGGSTRRKTAARFAETKRDNKNDAENEEGQNERWHTAS